MNSELFGFLISYFEGWMGFPFQLAVPGLIVMVPKPQKLEKRYKINNFTASAIKRCTTNRLWEDHFTGATRTPHRGFLITINMYIEHVQRETMR